MPSQVPVLELPHVVLVRPKYPFNIGMVSRCMSNLGFQSLILIEPRCELDMRAHEGAAGGQGPLRGVQIFETWSQFQSQHNGTFIMFTAQKGEDPTILPVEEGTRRIQTASAREDGISIHSMYLFFGPEDHGFNFDDLTRASLKLSLPVYGNFQSYNISHAALLGLYLIRSALPVVPLVAQGPSQSYAFPDESVRSWLQALGFDLSKTRRNAFHHFKQMILRSLPSPQDLNLIEKIAAQSARKLGADRKLDE